MTVGTKHQPNFILRLLVFISHRDTRDISPSCNYWCSYNTCHVKSQSCLETINETVRVGYRYSSFNGKRMGRLGAFVFSDPFGPRKIISVKWKSYDGMYTVICTLSALVSESDCRTISDLHTYCATRRWRRKTEAERNEDEKIGRWRRMAGPPRPAWWGEAAVVTVWTGGGNLTPGGRRQCPPWGRGCTLSKTWHQTRRAREATPRRSATRRNAAAKKHQQQSQTQLGFLVGGQCLNTFPLPFLPLFIAIDRGIFFSFWRAWICA